MDSVSIYDPKISTNLNFSDFDFLKLSRPTHKIKFVRHGDGVQLLVFLDEDKEIPFVRVPIDVLLNGAKDYELQR